MQNGNWMEAGGRLGRESRGLGLERSSEGKDCLVELEERRRWGLALAPMSSAVCRAGRGHAAVTQCSEE